MATINSKIQSISIDILQALVARGDVDVLTLQTTETVIIGKLFSCVHAGRLDLQNKLLHLLHSIISAFRSHATSKQPEGPSYSVNPLLIQTLIDGIAVGTNRPVLQHWLDFVLMTIPQFHDMLQPAIVPLNNCVSKQLSAALVEIKQASVGDASVADITAFTTDADFMMLLNAIERLVLLSLSQFVESTQVEDEGLGDKPIHDGSGILGYVSNVFSAEGTSNIIEESSSVSVYWKYSTLINSKLADKGARLSMPIRSNQCVVHDVGTTCQSFGTTVAVTRRVVDTDIYALKVTL